MATSIVHSPIVAALTGTSPLANLAEMLARLDRIEHLTDRQRADLRSSVITVGRVLGLPLDSMPARLDLLRARLGEVLPAGHGMSRQHWNNVRSRFGTALRLAGCELLPGRFLSGLSPAWTALRAQLADRALRDQLSRLMHYGTVEGVAPEAVDDALMARFHEALLTRSLTRAPEQSFRATVTAWNRAVERVPGWPQRRLAMPLGRQCYVRPLESFPASFQRDVVAWLRHLAGEDPLADLPFDPVKPSTISCRRFGLRQLASALIERGRDPACITCIADLVSIAAAREALGFFLERSGNQPTSQIGSLASLLLSLARHWVKVPPDIESQLKGIVRRCRPKLAGMTPKNRAMLRRFNDPATVERLLDLPRLLSVPLQLRRCLNVREARQVQMALVVELLLAVPIRLVNLAALDLERHLVRTGAGRNVAVHLYLPAAEVKNAMPLEVPLPATSVRLLDAYLARARPVLLPRPGSALFPGLTAGSRNKTALGTQIRRLMEQRLGVRVTAHQFRHLAGFLYLQHQPGDYETIRVLLGHKKIQTTLDFYAGLEAAAAARRYDEVVRGGRQGRQGLRAA